MKQKAKFNFCDLLIIIFVLVCFIGILFRSSIAGALSSAVYSDTAEIAFVIEQADEQFFSSITAGDIFYLENGAEFGMLMEGYTRSDSVQYVRLANGSLEKNAIDGKCDITGTFTVTGRDTDGGFLCSTEKLFVNSKITLHSKQSVCTVTVKEIKNISTPNTVE